MPQVAGQIALMLIAGIFILGGFFAPSAFDHQYGTKPAFAMWLVAIFFIVIGIMNS